ncbi:MAG: hypothetical protein ACREBW_06345 [Candidatus Micrarchaeaceae archaeon]
MLKFVAKRNKMPYKKDLEELIADIEDKGILAVEAIESAKLAWRHRNDFHHLTPGMASIDLAAKAKECVEATCAVENDIFGASFSDGALVPNKPLYWDVRADRTMPVFIRNLDV